MYVSDRIILFSSSYSSHSDSSRSPSPQKQKAKKKVLTKKQPAVTKTAAPNAPVAIPASGNYLCKFFFLLLGFRY